MKRIIVLFVACAFLFSSFAWATEEVRPLGMSSATGGTSGDIRVGNTCTTSSGGKYYCGFNTRHVLFFTDNTVSVDVLYPLASGDTGFPYVLGGTWTVDSEATYLGRFGTGADNTTFLRGDGTWAVPPGTEDTGDMDKATYDVNDDGVVDSAIATAITDGLIVDADVNASAAIAGSKVSDNTVTPAKLYNTSGTPSGSTWYRGDGAWASITATPGGSDGQMQFNLDGTFGAMNSTGYDNVAETVTLVATIAPSFTATQTASPGCVKLWEGSGGGGEASGFCAPATLSDNVYYTLPSAAGNDGDVLTTNGSKVLSWTAPGTATAIPQGADPTVDSAGEIAIDTTAAPDQLRYYGGAEVVIDARRTENATFKSPASGDKAKFRKPYGMTIASVGCVTDAATSAILDIQECDANGANCATSLSGTITCGTTYGTGTVSDSSIDAGDYVFFSVGTVTGSVGYLYVDFNYTVTKE